VAYHLIVQRKTGLTRADYKLHDGPTPTVGATLKHQVGDAAMRIMITAVRTLPPDGFNAQPVDQVTAAEI
jgi:hypothetical protein